MNCQMFLVWAKNKDYTVILASWPHRSSFSLFSQLIMIAFEKIYAMKYFTAN